MSRVDAENRGSGNQFLQDGDGDQNVANDSGRVYKIGHQFNIQNWGDTAAKEMPSLFHLSQHQSQLFGELARRPDRQKSADRMVDWLKRQPNQTPLNSIQPYHNECLRKVVQGTGRWILETEGFLAWKDASSPSRLLRISLIIDSIEKQAKNGKNVACVYFYFREGEEHRVSFVRVWATLLEQLLQASDDLGKDLEAIFDESLQGSTQLNPTEYIELFKARAASVETVYLVIDALDIYQDTCKETQQMRDALQTLPDNIRILFTCRDDSFELGFGVVQKLRIAPRSQDVETYVSKRIEDTELLRISLEDDQERRHIVRTVATMTTESKMFLLARLCMDELSKQGTFKEMKEVLGKLSDSKFDIFEASARRIAQKCDEKGHVFESSLTKHVFTWVVHAKAALTVEEICDSFAIQRSNGQSYQEHRPKEKLLMSACNGLVVIDPENETLSLVHKSVQTYLQKYQIIPGHDNVEMAKACISYLLVDTHDQGNRSPFLQYAAKYWWAHLDGKEKTDSKTDSEAGSLALKFLRDSSKLARAFKAIEGTDNHAFNNMTGLHATVHFNLLHWTERLLEEGVNVDTQCSDGQTALHWAVRYGRCEILKLLINKSANPNIGDQDGNTPLHKALIGPTADKTPLNQAITRSGVDDTKIVEALVANHKAQLNVKNKKGISPMSSAVSYGPTSIAKIMVKSQDDVNAEIFDGWTSLRLVFFHGHDILKSNPNAEGRPQLQHAVENHARSLTNVLLERGVDLNRRSADHSWTPLAHAAKNGDVSKMRRLLTRQPNPADVHLSDEGGPPLWWAVEYGYIAAVRLLVEHGANVNERYKDGSTSLSKAVEKKDSKMAQLLIEFGADVNTRTRDDSTPLIEAIKRSDKNTAWALLNANAALDECDTDDRSALFYAIKNKDRALAWLLIVNGDLAASPNKNIQNILELAVAHDDLTIAWLLCEHGASPCVDNGAGTTLLHKIAKKGTYKAMKFLVERSRTVDTKDAKNRTPLHCAVARCHDDIINLLISQTLRSPGELGLDIPDAKGNTALILATLMKQPIAMRSLLQHGAACNAANHDGRTALHYAARRFSEGLELILNGNFGANANVMDGQNMTPLHHAMINKDTKPETVEMLVKVGVNVDAQDKTGRTPLMYAAQCGQEKLVRALLSKGADVQIRDGNGWTAVSYAPQNPDIEALLRS
ncbi:ankyrin repeat-containing domain protein [Annulohypoxylon nitens]|nr:ankyrin repeat-containing domain protein [Annulohypoxylon nitens]